MLADNDCYTQDHNVRVQDSLMLRPQPEDSAVPACFRQRDDLAEFKSTALISFPATAIHHISYAATY